MNFQSSDPPAPSRDEWDEASEFGGIYRQAAAQSLSTRNPVIVIPGIMGSRLVAEKEQRSIWGDFAAAHARPSLAAKAQMIGLQMREGEPLDRLAGYGQTDGALADFRCKFAVHPPAPLRFDVVAHSMGGLVLRYYLQYGGQLLPYDGSPPRLTWDGAADVEHAILVGTPSGGSVGSLERLISGLAGNAVLPGYDPAILGTMPALYQLLPRMRHRPVEVENEPGTPDLLQLGTWIRLRWGLADPMRAATLRMLLPGSDSPRHRRRIALDHLDKCLKSARALQDALDIPVTGRPLHLKLHLFASDSLRTPVAASVSRSGALLSFSRHGPGDRVVLRSSALLDERAGNSWQPRIRSPIAWDGVTFVPGTHLGITHHPVTVDNILYLLLERPLD